MYKHGKISVSEVTEEGHYRYERPGWTTYQHVTVKKFAGVDDLQVWFDDVDYDYYVSMKDIPADALFEFSRNLRFWEKS